MTAGDPLRRRWRLSLFGMLVLDKQCVSLLLQPRSWVLLARDEPPALPSPPCCFGQLGKHW